MTVAQLAADLGSLENWDGTDVYVLRNDRGHFVTWAKATAATPTQHAVADGGELTMSWANGDKDITVTAENGTLYVTLESPDITFERKRARLDTVKGREVLNAGKQRLDSGKKIRALVTIGDRWDDLKQLKEDSEPEQTDEPLAYEVEEYETEVGFERTVTKTKTRLVATKQHKHMTDRQRDLHRKVDTDHDVPEDAIPGDIYTLEDLLEDARTADERDRDALDEAAKTGEEVVISATMADCNDADKECNTDHVRRIATPHGEIVTRRTHTY